MPEMKIYIYCILKTIAVADDILALCPNSTKEQRSRRPNTKTICLIMEFSDSCKNYNCARPRPSIYIFETSFVIPVFCYQTIGVLDLHFNYFKSDKE